MKSDVMECHTIKIPSLYLSLSFLFISSQLQILDHKVAYFLISHVNNYFNSSACFINPRFAFAKSLRLFNIYEGGVRLVI